MFRLLLLPWEGGGNALVNCSRPTHNSVRLAVLCCAGLQLLVALLLDIIPMLGSLAILTLFLFCTFGLVGVQLWKGMLRQRCFAPLNATAHTTLQPYFRPASALGTGNAPTWSNHYICGSPGACCLLNQVQSCL